MDGFDSVGADLRPDGAPWERGRKAKALLVLGTRPEAIKLAPLVAELRAGGVIEPVVCNTGQHAEMVHPTCRLFSIPVRYDLNVMRPAQDLGYVAGRVIQQIGEVIAAEQPGVCIVQGDTTTAVAGALAAFYRRVPVAHVEAGLRSGDMLEPWPEEANRIVISRISRIHFAPTAAAAEALRAEGAAADSVHLTGNTVVDAALHARQLLAGRTPPRLAGLGDELPTVLFTMHRRESFGQPIREVFMALRRLACSRPVQIAFPVHPNPNVRGPAQELLSGLPNLRLLPPLDYDEMIHLLDRSRFVITDSGGLVEEAPTFGKPVLILRSATERLEAVSSGCAVLCGYDVDRMLDLAGELLEDGPRHKAMSGAPNPFGDGLASRRIAGLLAEALGDGALGRPGLRAAWRMT